MDQQSGQNQNNQYDFILNPNQPQKKILNLPGGNSTKGRMIIAGIGLIIFIIIAGIFMNLILGAGKPDTKALVAAAKEQNELIRVAQIGVDKAQTQAAKDIAITTKLSLQSQQKEMLSAAASAGRKLNSKELSSSRNAKVDATLTEAEQNNRFDEVFIEVINIELKEYQQIVKRAYEGTNDKKLKEALAVQFQSANTLAGVTNQTDN